MNESFFARISATIATLGIMHSAAWSEPTKIGVRDETCRAKLITECVTEKRQEMKATCKRTVHPTGKFEFTCPSEYGGTVSNFINECKAIVDEWHYASCITEIDIATIASGEAIRAEIAETNRVLREDQRTLLNQLCRAVGGQPEKCDDALAPKK